VKANLIALAREASGLSQSAAAAQAGTSRPTLSAYEHGRTSPTLDTATRVLAAMGREFDTVAMVTFTDHQGPRGGTFVVPDRLWRLPVGEALGVVTLPLHLSWSRPGRPHDLRDRGQRARVYEEVLREGRARDLRQFVDGALLMDQWAELVLPQYLRKIWQPVVDAEIGQSA